MEYGIKLSVPEQSLKKGDRCVITIRVIALAEGSFSIPQNSEIVSAVYNIEVSGAELLKPVSIEMQHSVDCRNASAIHFVKADNKSLPNTFEKLENGDFFTPRIGKINIQSFSNFTIIYETNSPNDRFYSVTLLYFCKISNACKMVLLFTGSINAELKVRLIHVWYWPVISNRSFR